MSTPTIAILGAGFSGTMVAVHLLRTTELPALRILLIERRAEQGQGIAYSTRSQRHLLNVPAGNMSADPADPGAFTRFVESNLPGANAGTFVPRSLYGTYLAGTLAQAEAEARPGVSLERWCDEAVDLQPHGSRVRIVCRGGASVDAHHVVLASGSFPPGEIAGLNAQLRGTSRYIHNPWSPAALADAEQLTAPLLLGTGLTMVDLALELAARTPDRPILALSRRGLLPRAHPSSPLPPAIIAWEFDALPATCRAYVQHIRERVARAEAEGIQWTAVFNALRALTPTLWQRLPYAERRRFLRHLQPWWDAHRHRMAPQVASEIEQLTSAGTLRVLAGHVKRVEERANCLVLTVRQRYSGALLTLETDRVINCTGPGPSGQDDALWTALTKRGLIAPDPLGLGLALEHDYAVCDAGGDPSSWLSYVGPLLRAQYWEGTAVPELRVHAANLAERLKRALCDQASEAAYPRPISRISCSK